MLSDIDSYHLLFVSSTDIKVLEFPLNFIENEQALWGMVKAESKIQTFILYFYNILILIIFKLVCPLNSLHYFLLKQVITPTYPQTSPTPIENKPKRHHYSKHKI